MAEKLLEITDLSVDYGADTVVRNVSLSIGRGEIGCIVGESGSGKTTLLKAICGVEPQVHIGSGRVCFDGREVSAMSPKERRQMLGHEIGVISQNPSGSFNPLRKFDVQFKETMQSHGMEYNWQEILDLFERIGLEDGASILKSRPFEMSGGMNQRIAIAAVMLLQPKLLLCDEPTSALDVTSANLVVDLLCECRKVRNVGILMVTHNLGIAQKMADCVGIMKAGELIETQCCCDIFKAPQKAYTKQLIADVPKLVGCEHEE